MVEKKIRVTLVKSFISCKAGHQATARGLGFRRMHQTVELKDTPEVRGMINRISYLLRLEA